MHELVALFRSAEIDFDKRLVQMLDEHCSHQTERRGCGYTQATRFLSTFINQPRLAESAADLKVFVGWPVDTIDAQARALCENGWEHGWRRLQSAPVALLANSPQLQLVRDFQRCVDSLSSHQLTAESQILLSMIQDLINGSEAPLSVLPPMAEKPEIGSCSQAEEFFLEIAHGKIRRGGWVNVVLDACGAPLMIEKMSLGESHSAILLRSALLNGVELPPGSLLALLHRSDAEPESDQATTGRCLSLTDIVQARFLRLTTLAVAPELRKRAFSSQVAAQVRCNFVSPLSTTLDDLRTAADTYAGAMA